MQHVGNIPHCGPFTCLWTLHLDMAIYIRNVVGVTFTIFILPDLEDTKLPIRIFDVKYAVEETLQLSVIAITFRSL